MAAMKSALLVIALLLLGSERGTCTTLACTTAIAGCITAYTASKALNLLNPNSCDPYNTLKSCTQSLVSSNTCTQQEVNEYASLTSIRSTEARCSGTTAKASLIMIVITAVLGLIFKA